MGRHYRFGFVVEYTIGHVAFARMLESAVSADPSVEAHWMFVTPGQEGWPATMWPLSQNYTLRVSAGARRLLARAGELDGLLFHTQSLVLFSWGTMSRVPSVISLDATPRNSDEMAAGYGHAVGPYLVEEAKRALMTALLARARYLMAWTDRCARSLVQDYHTEPRRVRVVRPGVDLAAWQTRRGRRDGPLRLLFVGGDFEHKGGLELLEALAALSGEWECDLVTRASVRADRRVRVHRSLQPGDPELRELYRRADVFVLPSRAEAYGWAIIEAMAAGLPVVATSVGGIPELVGDSGTSVLVKPHDVAGLAIALEKLAADEAARREMGEAARLRAAELFDGRRNGQEVLDLLKAAADGGAPEPL